MFKFVIGIVAVVFFASCSAVNVLNPSASHIRILDDLPASGQCEYLGDVIGSEGKLYSAMFISNHDLTEGARSHMRNQAYEKGANVIVIDKNALVYTTSTVFVGTMYSCKKPNRKPE